MLGCPAVSSSKCCLTNSNDSVRVSGKILAGGSSENPSTSGIFFCEHGLESRLDRGAIVERRHGPQQALLRLRVLGIQKRGEEAVVQS
jgi:hypothetical protein